MELKIHSMRRAEQCDLLNARESCCRESGYEKGENICSSRISHKNHVSLMPDGQIVLKYPLKVLGGAFWGARSPEVL
jgi:hypothetical protein